MSGAAGRALMVQGTASSVGKSVIVTALCRVLSRRGLRVAPFKAQNMSNNSFVDRLGRELGRAQAVQAAAAGIEPLAEMNPILLKPEADHRSQLVVLGRPQGVLKGADFIRRKQELWPVVTQSLDALLAQYDIVVIEGAGSPAEINLKAGDIVNMRVALYAQAPVLLVGDIDRGGVFAHLVGTLELLEPQERALVRGMVINRFRGSVELLQPGITWLEERTGIPVTGVIPWLDDIGIAEEDAVSLESVSTVEATPFNVVALRFPHVANFDDLDALATTPGVAVRWVTHPDQLRGADLIVLPGSKATVADLDWLRRRGFAAPLAEYAAGGTALIGICGGYQMLGKTIFDPLNVESDAARVPGLGLLDVTTTFAREKSTRQVSAGVHERRGLVRLAGETRPYGYEIHMGSSEGGSGTFRLFDAGGGEGGRADGAMNAAGNVLGTYVHGLFDDPAFRSSVLATLGLRTTSLGETADSYRERSYDRLADHVAGALDMEAVLGLLGKA